MKEERLYNLDTEQGNYAIYDILDWDELYSLENSNRLSWSERKCIRQLYIPQRIIKEFAPVIACVAVASIVKEIITTPFQPTKKK